MSSIKNPTLRRRTKELTECAEDARECQLLGYELKDLGNLIVGMTIHMQDLQRKVDSQAEHIKTLNEKLTADTPQTERIKTLDYCDICNHKGCDNCIANNLDDYCVPSGYTPKDTPQTDCDHKCIQTEVGCEQTDCAWK